MGLICDTGRWPDMLWRSHMEKFPTAALLVEQGTLSQGRFGDFATDIHASLYGIHPPERHDDAPQWATSLLDEATALPEWQQLKRRCQANGFAAGVSAERLLDAILPLIPQEEKKENAPSPKEGPQEAPGSTQGQAAPITDTSRDTPAPGDAGTLRRALRQACREATKTVDEAEQATDSMLQAMGSKQGHGPGAHDSLKDLDEVRSLYALMRGNPTLKKIAELAGRLKRLGQAHKRTLVTPAVGSIKGITLGGDLERLLPSELAGLCSPVKLLKLQTLDKILNKRALQYLWRGVESETRGPIICLVDESGSMAGEKQTWSKAVALSLLTIATEQKRPCYMIGFESRITHEHRFEGGKVNTAELCTALMARCSGGTDISSALARGLVVFHQEPALKKADIILISDGQSSIAPAVINDMQDAQKQHGLHLYAILLGDDADPESVAPIATELYHVSNQPGQDTAKVVPLLAKIA